MIFGSTALRVVRLVSTGLPPLNSTTLAGGSGREVLVQILDRTGTASTARNAFHLAQFLMLSHPRVMLGGD